MAVSSEVATHGHQQVVSCHDRASGRGEDMAGIRREIPFVAGQAELSGHPSPVTVFGVHRGMKAAAAFRLVPDRPLW